MAVGAATTRYRWMIRMLLFVLTSLLVPWIASASTAVSSETRVGAFYLQDQACVRVERSLTIELHRGYELANDELASDSLLAATGGAKLSKEARKGIRSLEKEIQTFRNNIEKLRGGGR